MHRGICRFLRRHDPPLRPLTRPVICAERAGFRPADFIFSISNLPPGVRSAGHLAAGFVCVLRSDPIHRRRRSLLHHSLFDGPPVRDYAPAAAALSIASSNRMSTFVYPAVLLSNLSYASGA